MWLSVLGYDEAALLEVRPLVLHHYITCHDLQCPLPQDHDCSLRGGEALNLQVHHRHSFRGSISNCELPMVPNFNTHLMTLAKRDTRSNFVKNYDFDYPQCGAHFTVTCVAGHILQYDFAESHRKWTSCDPFDLFEARIEKQVAPDKKAIADNLRSEARKAQQLMIWTDCDREGENIGSEIKRICRDANPRITVKRARFSAIIAQCVYSSLSGSPACRWYIQADTSCRTASGCVGRIPGIGG